METYGRPFSFRLEDGFVLSNVGHLPLVDSLRGTCFLNWLGWEPVILDLLGEMFLISIIDVINPYNISVRH